MPTTPVSKQEMMISANNSRNGHLNHRYHYSFRFIYITFITIAISSCCITEGKHNPSSLKTRSSLSSSSIPSKKKNKSGWTLQSRVFKNSKDDDASLSRLSKELMQRGGDDSATTTTTTAAPTPSFYWGVFHNWLHMLSIGFNAINIQFVVRSIVDKTTDFTQKPSPEAIALSGKVESVDRLLTFLGIGFLSALSDKVGRKPLMIWSCVGFSLTNLIQAKCTDSVALLYLADFIDGCSSCMLPLCQAYVTDCCTKETLAASLGIFQGLSVGGAFILAFPIGGILGAKYGPRTPLLIASAIQLLNAILILFITPESLPPSSRKEKMDYSEANAIGGLNRLFGHGSLLRLATISLFFSSLGRMSLDAQFANYANIRFGWSQAQSGPLLVVVGLMLAIAPRILVPLLGLSNSILYGFLIAFVGYFVAGLSPTPGSFVFSIVIIAIGCTCFPALQALLANLANPNERGALLGAVASMNELVAAIGSTMYASILGVFTSDAAPLPLPGMQFMVGAVLHLFAWVVMSRGLKKNVGHPALSVSTKGVEYEGLGA